jgi:hypothetical protein
MTDTIATIDNSANTTITSDVVITKKPYKFVPPARNVRVLDSNNTILWEGQTNETKKQLKAKYNSNITVMYSVLYTTINAVQSYDEALVDPTQVSQWAYSFEEFEQWLNALDKDVNYTYIAYNSANLKRQKAQLVKNNKTGLTLYFYTSLQGSLIEGKFPIKGVTNHQADVARASLQVEDEVRAEFVSSNPNATQDDIKDQQIESVLFLAGSPDLIRWYINSTNVKWITGVNKDRKGLIHNTAKGNYQVTMLLLDVTLEENQQVMSQVGW